MSAPRRLALYVDSDELGGAEASTLTLLGALDRSRWSPTLIYHGAPAHAPLIAAAEALDIPAVVVPGMPEGLRGAARIPSFTRFLNTSDFDVFHAQLSWPLSGKFPLAAAILSRAPAVLATVHAFPEFTMTRPTAVQQRAIALGVGRYIAVSQDLAQKLIARMAIRPERIAVIHNGIDVPTAPPVLDAVLHAELSGPDAMPVVLSAARLIADKGIDVLLEAAAQVPQARFVIAGEGPERDALLAQIRRLGLGDRVSLLGWRRDVRALLAASNLFVLPSRNEGFPISLLEALACGTPIIASRIGGIPEMITHEQTGLLVPVDDPAALADAISAMLASATMRERFARAGRAAALEHHRAEPMAAAVSAEYERLLEPGRRRLRRAIRPRRPSEA
jgi:glycosyltransferase involved in cell wall biosynthesis